MAKDRYFETVDQINYGQYKVMLPENYAPVPDYYIEHNVAPFYEHDPNTQGELASGVATIAHMIDMHAHKYNFLICREADLIEIVSVMDRYLKQVDSIKVTDPAALSFIDKAKAFYTEVVRENKRMMRRHGIEDPDEKTLGGLLKKLFWR